jgi:hypothetical protein
MSEKIGNKLLVRTLINLKSKEGKPIPIIGRCETSRISHFLDNRLTGRFLEGNRTRDLQACSVVPQLMYM